MRVLFKPYATMTLSLLFLVACDKPIDRAKKYMKNKPNVEFAEMFRGNMAYTQSKLDSVAYKDVFESTNLSKDSANLKGFSLIAKKMRGYKYNEMGLFAKKEIKKSAQKAQMPKDVYDNIFGKIFSDISDFQHESDKWAYANFFSRLGLMKNEKFSKKFEEVSKLIEP